MAWDVEYTDAFGDWWATLEDAVGADKTGRDRWYDEMVPVADRLYDEHLETLHREGLI